MMNSAKEYYPLWDIENVLPILHKISILGGLTEKQLYTVFRMLEKVFYPAGDVVFEQGSEPSHIYIIQKGEIKMVVEAEGTALEIIRFEVGQSFGETSVIGIQPHSASAIAVVDTELIVLSRRTLLSIFDSDKELFGLLILNIAREACRRLNKTDEILLHYVLRK